MSEPASLDSPSPVHVWLLSGPPGIGKSTVVARVVYLLRTAGRGVGGCLTKERREGRERVGFTIIDLMSGREAELASSRTALGPRVGRYRVNISGLTEVGARALTEAAAGADVIVIDEVGPMELTSQQFKRGIEACLSSAKPILAVLHYTMKDPIVDRFNAMESKTMVEVTLQNRERLADEIVRKILALLPPLEGDAVGQGRGG